MIFDSNRVVGIVIAAYFCEVQKEYQCGEKHSESEE